MISVVDLGIVRDVAWRRGRNALPVTLTPTYSGCPATAVIALDVETALQCSGGSSAVELRTQLAPAWTTDWLSDKGPGAAGTGIRHRAAQSCGGARQLPALSVCTRQPDQPVRLDAVQGAVALR